MFESAVLLLLLTPTANKKLFKLAVSVRNSTRHKPRELALRHEENIKGNKTVETRNGFRFSFVVVVFFLVSFFTFGVSKSFCCVHCAAKQHFTVEESAKKRKINFPKWSDEDVMTVD